MFLKILTISLLFISNFSSIGASQSDEEDGIFFSDDSIEDLSRLHQAGLLKIDDEKINAQIKFIQDTIQDIPLDSRNAQKILLLYHTIKGELDDVFYQTISKGHHTLMEKAEAHFKRHKHHLQETILRDDIESFKSSFEEYLALTGLYIKRNAMHCSRDELNDQLKVINALLTRLTKLENHLQTFKDFKWLAAHRLSGTSLIFMACIAWFTGNNSIACYIIRFLVETDRISSLTEMSVYALTSALVIVTIVLFMYIMPTKYLCCKKNSYAARVASPNVEQMLDIVRENIDQLRSYKTRSEELVEAQIKKLLADIHTLESSASQE